MMLTAAENLLRVLHGREPEWIPVECLSDRRYGDGAYTFVTHARALAPKEGGNDLWGVTWTGTGESLPYPSHHPASSLEQTLALPFPEIHAPELWVQAQSVTGAARGGTVVIARQVCALFERYWSLVGMENALVGMVSEPELAAAVLGRIGEWQLSAADHFIQVGVEAARISDDYGAQGDLIMSPSSWRSLIHPQLARLVERYQSAGLPVILHSCGKLARIMDDLIELGFAAFNIQTSVNDLPALKKRYGRRLCIWGGISTQTTLETGAPEKVRESVRQAIAELGHDGLLVLEPDQMIRVPEPNLQAYSEAAREYKRSFTRGLGGNRTGQPPHGSPA